MSLEECGVPVMPAKILDLSQEENIMEESTWPDNHLFIANHQFQSGMNIGIPKILDHKVYLPKLDMFRLPSRIYCHLPYVSTTHLSNDLRTTNLHHATNLCRHRIYLSHPMYENLLIPEVQFKAAHLQFLHRCFHTHSHHIQFLSVTLGTHIMRETTIDIQNPLVMRGILLSAMKCTTNEIQITIGTKTNIRDTCATGLSNVGCTSTMSG